MLQPRLSLSHFADADFVIQAQRRGIKYELLPPGMQRRKLNSSRFDRRSRTIFWHIHWHFPAASESVHDLRVSEQTPLKQILQQHISLSPGNLLRRHALRMHVEAGLDKLQILMKKEHCPVSIHLPVLRQQFSTQLLPVCN